ncbi:asparagine synthetase B family protein [Azohydromonas sediminis]|uniref:asparagine synthase-related protein n=1 Tax=Azohydromonas sediminis TaxID=2259674 RepID=UPI000E64DA25|nr:asparagine synthetase B family protein [Azohydromonas sediminis]
MALIVGVWDSEAQRADSFLASTAQLAPPLPWLARTVWRSRDLKVAVDGLANIPFAQTSTETGTSVLVIGDIVHDDAATTTADWLVRRIEDDGPSAVCSRNGYYLAVATDGSQSLHLGADQLGLFPLYYWSHGATFAFATSPNAFIYHPFFHRSVDLSAVAGVLLTQHPTGNRTIWRKVRRVPPGHLLTWNPIRREVTMRAVNPLTVDDTFFDQPLSTQQRAAFHALNDAVRRRAKLGRTSVLLSGGLDSRLVAGVLRWHSRDKVPTLTLGEPGDYELHCAKAVAKSLRWWLRTIPVDLARYPEWAGWQQALDGAGATFTDFMWWPAAEVACQYGSRIMSGLLGDAIMGGSQIMYAYGGDPPAFSMDRQLARTLRMGYAPAEVSALLRSPGLGEAIVDELRATWRSYSGTPSQKAWQFDLYHRQRHHAGAVPARLAFGSWPTLPYADNELLKTMAGLPACAFADRRLQAEFLTAKLPRLARLPLDRGGPDMTPVRPTPFWPARAALQRSAERFRHWLAPREARQYVRHFDLSGPGFAALRRSVHPLLSQCDDVFDPAVAKRLLPPPESAIDCPDAIIDSAKYKSLIGLMMQLARMREQAMQA